MKGLLFALTVLVPVACPCLTAHSQPGAPARETAAGQGQAAQPADLAEAERLTREVVRLFQAGKYEEALPFAERALALREKALGPDSAEAGRASSNLATILNRLGRYDRARAAYERALPVLEGKLGADDPLTNQTREDLAGVYFKQGDYRASQELLERTLSSREKTLGPDHDLVARALVDLGFVYIAQRYATKREATMRRLLDLAEKRPEPALTLASSLFKDYFCIGSVAPGAPAEQKEIVERIERLWHRQRYGESPSVVSGEVLNGRAVSKPAPAYPVLARNKGVQGTVVVGITVDESGRVLEASPLCGPPLLQGAGLDAAKGWKFTPTLLNGAPVKVTGTISFHFTLQ